MTPWAPDRAKMIEGKSKIHTSQEIQNFGCSRTKTKNAYSISRWKLSKPFLSLLWIWPKLNWRYCLLALALNVRYRSLYCSPVIIWTRKIKRIQNTRIPMIAKFQPRLAQWTLSRSPVWRLLTAKSAVKLCKITGESCFYWLPHTHSHNVGGKVI